MKEIKSKNVKNNWSTKRILALIGLVLVLGSGSFWVFSQNANKGNNLANLAGVVYGSPIISSNKVSLPLDTLKSDKLVFMDIKLDSPQQQLTYAGRVIPLADYRGGAYLPILMIYTPQGNLVSGIRVCEPCGSFSFHIVDGKLDCDRCHTQWNLETLKGISGGCQSFPPPRLSSTLANSPSVDLSSTGLRFA
jgi:hypothetical protein